MILWYHFGDKGINYFFPFCFSLGHTSHYALRVTVFLKLKRCSSNYIVARSPFRLFSMMDSRSQDATQGTIFTLQYASAGLIEKQNFFSCYFITYVQLIVDTNKLALKHYQVFNFNTSQTIKYNSNVWILLHKLHGL